MVKEPTVNTFFKSAVSDFFLCALVSSKTNCADHGCKLLTYCLNRRTKQIFCKRSCQQNMKTAIHNRVFCKNHVQTIKVAGNETGRWTADEQRWLQAGHAVVRREDLTTLPESEERWVVAGVGLHSDDGRYFFFDPRRVEDEKKNGASI